MSKSRLVILAVISLFSFVSHSAEAINYFSRINEEDALLQTAYKTYIKTDLENPKRTIIVQLIGLYHMGIPQYYRDVEKLIEGKSVLYELPGNTIEARKKWYAKIGNLSSPHKERLAAIGPLFNLEEPADALGQVAQMDCLSYEGCKELIHADLKVLPFPKKSISSVNWEALEEKDFEIILEQGSEEDLKKFIIQVIPKFMKQNEIPCDESNIDENLYLLRQKITEKRACSAEICSKRLRRHESNARSFIEKIFACQRDKVSFEDALTPSERLIMIERNDVIFASLSELFDRAEILAPIAVVYGAAHLPFVEKFLIEQGFIPLAGGDGWLTNATNLRECQF